MVFYGKGGYTWDIIYNMPVWLRNYIFSKMQKFYKPEDDKSTNHEQPPPVNIPKKQPTYSTKASK
jgi:hypothetical protein